MIIKTILTTRRATLHAVVPDAEKDDEKITMLIGVIVETHEIKKLEVWHYIVGLGFLPVDGLMTLDEARAHFNQDFLKGSAA